MGTPDQSRIAAVLVAAGQGLRAGQPVPKQFARWRGKPVVRHAAEALLAAGAEPIAVAIPYGADAIATEVLATEINEDATLVAGGAGVFNDPDSGVSFTVTRSVTPGT